MKILITQEFQEQINMLHQMCGDIEWSGILFYKTNTNNQIQENSIITPKYIYPMDVGTSAATNFEFNESVLDAYDMFPEAEDCREGLIHTHHRMGAFHSKTDLDELEDNSHNYDFYLSLVVDYARNYKAKIGFKPNKIKFIIERESGNSEFFTDNSTTIYDMDVPVEFEFSIPENPLIDKVKDLIAAAKAKTYSTKNYEKNNSYGNYRRSSNYGTKGGENLSLPFPKNLTGTTNTTSETKEKEKKKISSTTQADLWDFLAKWISQDIECTLPMYRAILDTQKEYNSYKDEDKAEALDFLETQLYMTFDEFFDSVFDSDMEQYIEEVYGKVIPKNALLLKMISAMTTVGVKDECAIICKTILQVLNKMNEEICFVHNIK